MATLYKRANPSQRRILRIVEGAVLNVADAHKIPRDEFLARSIAKRAAGTLSAQWTEVLAAHSTSPEIAGVSTACRACERRAEMSKRAVRRPSHLFRRSPLTRLWREIAGKLRKLKGDGNLEQAEIYIEVLRMIAKIQRRTIET